jgi:hypothetical protein
MILTERHCGKLIRIDSLRLQVADQRDGAGSGKIPVSGEAARERFFDRQVVGVTFDNYLFARNAL